MKVSIVAITDAATPIPASIAAKYCSAQEAASTRVEPLIVNFRQNDGTYSADVTLPAGSLIEIFRTDGIVARPPSYSAYQIPATGEAYFKIRCATSGHSCNLEVIEQETIPVRR